MGALQAVIKNRFLASNQKPRPHFLEKTKRNRNKKKHSFVGVILVQDVATEIGLGYIMGH